MQRSLLLLLVLILGGCATDRISERQYPIHLTRKAAVGERYLIVAHGSDAQRAETDAEAQATPTYSEMVQVEIRAEAEVLALSPTGLEAKTRLVIELATVTQAGKPVELLAPGTTVVAERIGGKTRYLVSGVAEPRLDRYLSIAGIPSLSDDEANDDAIYGSTKPRKIGESWPINSAVAAASLAEDGIPAAPENISGSTTLIGVIEEEGGRALRISGSMSMNGISPPPPPGFSTQSCTFSGVYSGVFPVNPAERVRQEQMSVEVRAVVVGTKAGKSVTATITRKTSREVLVTPVAGKSRSGK